MSSLWQWWTAGRMHRRLSRTFTVLDRQEKQSRQTQKLLRQYQTLLENREQEAREALREIRNELESIRNIQQQYIAEMESLRSRLQVNEEVTIPMLVGANKLVQERIEADIVVQAKRAAGTA